MKTKVNDKTNTDTAKSSSGGIKSSSEKAANFIIHIIFILLCVVFLGSFLMILGSSFQSQEDIMQHGYSIIPRAFTLDAYKMILENNRILVDAYLVTILTTVVGTVVGVWIVASFGYVLSRRDYPYTKILSFYVFFTMLFHGGLVPTYILISRWLGLKDNILALIIPLLVSAWYIMIMKGFFSSIPTSLIEAGKIDGASEMYIFLKIVIPISKPALATVALFYTLSYWNDYWLSLLYIESSKLIKLQYLLMRVLQNAEFLNSAEALEYGAVTEGMEVPTLAARMAMCVLAAGPILVIFPFFQKNFVTGLTLGSVKG